MLLYGTSKVKRCIQGTYEPEFSRLKKKVSNSLAVLTGKKDLDDDVQSGEEMLAERTQRKSPSITSDQLIQFSLFEFRTPPIKKPL